MLLLNIVRLLNAIAIALYSDTFCGLPTRVLYIFVGLAPLILFITGFVMWWHRRKPKVKQVNRASILS